MQLWVAALAVLVCSWSAFAGNWQTLSNCTFVANHNNDGDSFRVNWGASNVVVRLNFIDTPESIDLYHDRVRDQATYFRITPEEAVCVGLDAKAFTAARRQSNRFDVVTRWQNAAGSAAARRVYGYVHVGGADLAELLVEHGLARVYGEANSDASNHVVTDRLRTIEAAAQAAKRGAWALSSTNAVAEVVAETGFKLSGSGVRHNAQCRYYGSPSCQPCHPSAGKPCKACGG